MPAVFLKQRCFKPKLYEPSVPNEVGRKGHKLVESPAKFLSAERVVNSFLKFKAQLVLIPVWNQPTKDLAKNVLPGLVSLGQLSSCGRLRRVHQRLDGVTPWGWWRCWEVEHDSCSNIPDIPFPKPGMA